MYANPAYNANAIHSKNPSDTCALSGVHEGRNGPGCCVMAERRGRCVENAEGAESDLGRAPFGSPSSWPAVLATRHPSATSQVPSGEGKSPRLEPWGLPLLCPRPGFALVSNDGMQLQLDGVLRRVPAEALAPVVADCVGEDVAIAREGGRCDGAADLGVALETVLGVLVPEVECAVGCLRC